MYNGSKYTNGSFSVIRKPGHGLREGVNGYAQEDPLAKLNGLADGNHEVKRNGFDLNGSIGGSPSGSVYESFSGSHDASCNGSVNGSQCPTDDEDDDDGDAFEEMIDALSEMEPRTASASASASTAKTSKQDDARLDIFRVLGNGGSQTFVERHLAYTPLNLNVDLGPML